MEKAVLTEINKYRISKGREALRFNKTIYMVAMDQTQYLKTRKRLSHNQPTPGKRNVGERFRARVKAGSYSVGENLARTFVLTPTYNYDTKGSKRLSTCYTYEEAARAMVNAWRQSNVHNKNILNTTFDITGIAIYYNKRNNSLTATQVFAKINS
jgi:uncharacterized protein YkwD